MSFGIVASAQSWCKSCGGERTRWLEGECICVAGCGCRKKCQKAAVEFHLFFSDLQNYLRYDRILQSIIFLAIDLANLCLLGMEDIGLIA